MKKAISLILVLLMAVTLTACSQQSATPPSPAVQTPSDNSATSPVATPEPVNAEPAAATLDYPKGDFRIVVPNATGGGADVVARLIAKYLKDELGATVIVENKPGGGGIVALTELVNSQPNQDMVQIVSNTHFTIDPHFDDSTLFSLDDVVPVIGLDRQERVLFVNKDKSGISDFQGLLDYGKDNFITFGAGNERNQMYIIQKGIFDMNGIESEMVQHDSNQEGLTNLLGGHIICTVAPPAVGAQFVQEGSLVPIAIFSNEPYTGYEGITVPTAASLGVDIVSDGFRFIAVRGGTDQEIIDYLYDAFTRVFANPEFIVESEAQDAAMSGYNTQECIDHLNKMLNDHAALLAHINE